jgi:hypothetical protein
VAKPSFQAFSDALLHEGSRRDLGIPLDTIGAFQVLRDENSMRDYYRAWTPTFRALPRPRVRPDTAQQRKRTALGWVMLVIVAAVSVAVIVTAGSALFGLFTGGAQPGGITLPDWWQPF